MFAVFGAPSAFFNSPPLRLFCRLARHVRARTAPARAHVAHTSGVIQRQATIEGDELRCAVPLVIRPDAARVISPVGTFTAFSQSQSDV